MILKLTNNATHLHPLLIFKPVLVHNNAAKKIWISLLDELEEAGWSKKDIADNSHISLKTLKRLENGEVKEPTYSTFKKLLTFYCSSILAASQQEE